ncbi:MAG: DUF6252 family protein [Bacteroidales bacterium]
MQKVLTKCLAYLAVAFILFGNSCSIDEGGPTGPTGSKSVTEGIEARVDSAVWKAFNYSAFLCGKQLTIMGLDSTNGKLTITLNDTVAGKTYDLNTVSAHWATYQPNNSNDIYTTFSHPLAGGMVFLSLFNKDSLIVSGSFIFYAYNPRTKRTITISEGDFANISYTKETYPTSGIRAYIDGKLWNATTSQGTINDDGITLQGTNAGGEQLFFKICNRLKDTYALNSQSCHMVRYIVSSTDTVPFFSNSSPYVDGKFVISDISTDSVAQGSFILSVYRPNDKKTVQITQGIFSGIKLR